MYNQKNRLRRLEASVVNEPNSLKLYHVTVDGVPDIMTDLEIAFCGEVFGQNIVKGEYAGEYILDPAEPDALEKAFEGLTDIDDPECQAREKAELEAIRRSDEARRRAIANGDDLDSHYRLVKVR